MATALFDSKSAKFNRAAIMRRAWAILRSQFGSGPYRFVTTTLAQNFGWALSEAWREAKEARAKAQEPKQDNSGQIIYLKQRINALQYRSFRTNIAEERCKLEAEIQMLEAA